MNDFIEKFDDVFSGSPWYGKSIIEILEGVNDANRRFEDGHSIGQLLEHIIAWRKYTLAKIKAENDYEIKLDSIDDWSKSRSYSKDDFEILIMQLKETQNEIKSLVVDKPNSWLDENVSGTNHDYRFLLDGILQHDIYHVGQIAILR